MKWMRSKPTLFGQNNNSFMFVGWSQQSFNSACVPFGNVQMSSLIWWRPAFSDFRANIKSDAITISAIKPFIWNVWWLNSKQKAYKMDGPFQYSFRNCEIRAQKKKTIQRHMCETDTVSSLSFSPIYSKRSLNQIIIIIIQERRHWRTIHLL